MVSNATSPAYLSDTTIPISSMAGHCWLRSAMANEFNVPCTRTQFGDRAFSVAEICEWNNLPLWLQLADKSAPKNLSTWHRWPVNWLTWFVIVPRMANKSVELIVHARHEWSINRPRDHQPWKDENLCLSILAIIHKSGNWVFWFSL